VGLERGPLSLVRSEPFHRMDRLTRLGFTEGFRVSTFRPSLSNASRRVFLNLLTSAFFVFMDNADDWRIVDHRMWDEG
jgi:hypothetical protein